MRRGLSFAALMLVVSLAAAQTPAHKLADYAGTWQASFQGKPFMTIKLHDEKGQLTGTVSSGDLEVNADGQITSAKVREGESPILTSRILANGSLQIVSQDPDGTGTTTFVITLLDKNSASLRFEIPPDAGVRIKPVPLKKVPNS
jgi:hypothetical protein